MKSGMVQIDFPDNGLVNKNLSRFSSDMMIQANKKIGDRHESISAEQSRWS